MNIHHLELFYYVGKYHGISEAVRRMPYGIQQPAVSEQILKLERAIGKKLFVRQPFSLTPTGEKLMCFIAPFFEELPKVAKVIQDEQSQQLRIAAPSIVLRDYAHPLYRKLKDEFPSFHLLLRDLNQNCPVDLVKSGQIDLAISPVDEKPQKQVKASTLLRVPMVLLVKKSFRFKCEKDILRRSAQLTLITPMSHSPITRQFHSYLDKQQIQWPERIEVDSIDMVRDCVAKEMGVGLAVGGINSREYGSLLEIPLDGVPAIKISAIWQGELLPIGKSLIEFAKSVSGKITESLALPLRKVG